MAYYSISPPFEKVHPWPGRKETLVLYGIRSTGALKIT